jgi:hypothetical protein
MGTNAATTRIENPVSALMAEQPLQDLQSGNPRGLLDRSAEADKLAMERLFKDAFRSRQPKSYASGSHCRTGQGQ